MTPDQIKSMLDSYASACEAVGRHPFYGQEQCSMIRSQIDAGLDGLTTVLKSIQHDASGDSPLDAKDACDAIMEKAGKCIGSTNDAGDDAEEQ